MEKNQAYTSFKHCPIWNMQLICCRNLRIHVFIFLWLRNISELSAHLTSKYFPQNILRANFEILSHTLKNVFKKHVKKLFSNPKKWNDLAFIIVP